MADKDLVEYFIKQTDNRFMLLEKKIDILISFRWKIVGGAIGLSIMFSTLIQLIGLYYRRFP